MRRFLPHRQEFSGWAGRLAGGPIFPTRKIRMGHPDLMIVEDGCAAWSPRREEKTTARGWMLGDRPVGGRQVARGKSPAACLRAWISGAGEDSPVGRERLSRAGILGGFLGGSAHGSPWPGLRE
jgi:hypothetical protein